jgi:type II secretory pathway pseudopilin PulG
VLRVFDRSIHDSQRGFFTLEVLVATAITGIIGAGIGMASFQIINVNARSTKHVIAVKQVESAMHWISRDTQMSQTVQPAAGSGFPLDLSWVEWDNTGHRVTYTLENGELHRQHYVNQVLAGESVVATSINGNGEMTNCQYDGGMFTFKITASVGGFRSASETRTAKVIPRPAP